jgi:hypothetical protein
MLLAVIALGFGAAFRDIAEGPEVRMLWPL